MSAPPPLWLDYRRPPPGRELPGRVLLGFSLLLGVILFILSRQLGDEVDSLGQQVSRQRVASEQQRLFAESAASTAGGPQAAAPSAESWDALFAALETASDESVTLLGLAPANRAVRITGEARDLVAALAYAQRLQAAPILGDAHLEQYEVVRDHPRQPVRFTIQAVWREGGR